MISFKRIRYKNFLSTGNTPIEVELNKLKSITINELWLNDLLHYKSMEDWYTISCEIIKQNYLRIIYLVY